MTDLSTLLSRVESGGGADHGLSLDVGRALGLAPPFGDLITDLNAVIAMVEARLPGWRWMVRRMEPQPGAPSQYAAYVQNTEEGLYCWRAASIAARALLAALIRAEMEKVSPPPPGDAG